jgi:hypothetical protein
MIVVIKMTMIQVHLQLHDYFGQSLQHVLVIETTFWRSESSFPTPFPLFTSVQTSLSVSKCGFDRFETSNVKRLECVASV